MVGAGGGRSYTVIGDAVNTAARLEAQAPVGGVAISASTLARLPDATREAARGTGDEGKARDRSRRSC